MIMGSSQHEPAVSADEKLTKNLCCSVLYNMTLPEHISD